MNNVVKKITGEIVEETSMKFSCCPSINVCGKEIEIENYKKIYKLTKEEIIVLFTRKSDDLRITGNDLRIKKVSQNALIITGDISEMIYLNRNDKKEYVRKS